MGHNAHSFAAHGFGGIVVALLFWYLGRSVGADNLPPLEIMGPAGVVLAGLVNRAYSRLVGDSFSPGGGESGRATPAILVVLALIGALLLSGCQTTHRAPQTVLEGLYISHLYIETAARGANDARAAGALDAGRHEQILDQLQELQDAATLARQAYAAGRLPDAQAGLDRVESGLRIVAALLAAMLPPSPENQALIERYGV